MNIVGKAQLVRLKADGTQEPVGPVECNDICWPVIRQFFFGLGQDLLNMPTKRDSSTESSSNSARWRMYWATKDITPTKLNAWVRSDGTANVSVDTPYWTAGATAADPDIMTFTAVFTAPVGSPRTIRVLGLEAVPSATTYNAMNALSSPLTILRLSVPCVQAVDEQLLVTYRLFFYPAEPASQHNTTNAVYSDIRTMFKNICEAVASTNVSYRQIIGVLSSSSYEFQSLTQLTHHHEDVPSTLSSAQELLDCGFNFLLNDTTMRAYTNVIGITQAFASTHTPSKGCFAKYLTIGDAGITSSISATGIYRKMFHYDEVSPGVTNPIQSVFLHRNSPVGPFNETNPANMGTQTGVLTLNADNYVDSKTQKLFRIVMTTGGDMATPATYQVHVGTFTGGFAGNQWLPRTAIFPQPLVADTHFRRDPDDMITEDYTRAGGTVYRSPDNNRKVLVVNGQRTKAGVCIYDVLDGSKRNFNALSTPALPITAAADGECAKGYSFIACADTGLYRINPALDTVEHIPSPTGVDKAYQLCVKNDANNTLWVLFDGGLCKLSNPDAALGALSWTVHNSTVGSPTFTYAGITDANWSSVTSMAIDPDNLANDQFLLITSNTPGGTTGSWRASFVWWNTGTGVAAFPATAGIPFNSFTWNQTNLLRMCDSLRCAGGRWVSQISNPVSSTGATLYHFTYGAASLSANTLTANAPARLVPVYLNSVPAFVTCKLDTGVSTFYPGAVVLASSLATITNASTLNIANASVEFMLREGSTSYHSNINAVSITSGNLSMPLIYLPGSNMIFSFEYTSDAYGVTPLMLRPTNAKYATYEGLFWRKYGWNGTSWELNHAGSRDVHAGLETLPGLDGIRCSFANGVSGTSFVANEFWDGAIGKGLLKDDGVTYNFTLSFAIEPTERLTVSTNVPAAALGALVDEPVTFTAYSPDSNSGIIAATVPRPPELRRCIQNKGLLIQHPNSTSNNHVLIADQLIPGTGSTDFDLRFKWISFEGDASSSYYKALGVTAAAGPYTNSNLGLHFRYNAATGNLEVYNNAVAVGAAITTPDITKECRIARVGSTVTAYYDGNVIGSVTLNGQLAIVARGGNGTYETGWYDMKVSYTENRRVVRLGDSGTQTGSYSPKFAGMTCTATLGGERLYIGSGSPLEAILDYTPANVAIAGTGRIKVAAGAGWLVFHDSEVANPVTGNLTAHYVVNTF